MNKLQKLGFKSNGGKDWYYVGKNAVLDVRFLGGGWQITIFDKLDDKELYGVIMRLYRSWDAVVSYSSKIKNLL